MFSLNLHFKRRFNTPPFQSFNEIKILHFNFIGKGLEDEGGEGFFVG